MQSNGRRSVRRQRWVVAAALACSAAFGLAPEARADEAQTQAAEALYRQAKALMDRGELEEACEKFAASHALEPGVGTLLYLGDCYERAGRFASALETFEAAAKLAEDRGDDARQHLASVRAKALGPRTPKLEIRSRGALSANFQITVNGAPLEHTELNRPLARDEGEYDIGFSAPGRDSFVSHIELKNGAPGVTVVDVPRLIRTSSPVASEVPMSDDIEDAERGDGQRVVAWIVGGAGMALAITAGVFTTLAVKKNDDSKGSCDPSDPNRCDLEGVRLRGDAKSNATIATVTGIVGGLAVASGVVLYVTAPESESGVPEGAMLMLNGRF